MTAMPDITTVWVVHLDSGSPLDTKGTLAMSDAEIAFSGDDGRQTRIPLLRITQVKRTLGSPVMIVTHVGDEGRRRTAFYFSQPPPLHAPDDASRMRRRRTKKASVGYLGQQNINRKPLIRAWVQEIKDAIRELESQRRPPSEGGR
jgi:hypothetical protein